MDEISLTLAAPPPPGYSVAGSSLPPVFWEFPAPAVAPAGFPPALSFSFIAIPLIFLRIAPLSPVSFSFVKHPRSAFVAYVSSVQVLIKGRIV